MGALDDIENAGTARVGERTETTEIDGYTIVDTDPNSLAEAAGLDLDTYALARMVASEEYSGTALHLLVLAESAKNQARHLGTSVSNLLLRSNVEAASGRFSEQAAGKWASTRADPNERHLAAARAALNGSDFIRGARDFFDPKSQDGGKQGSHTLRKTSEEYIAENAARRLEWIGELDGIDPYRLMLFADVSGTADTGPALAALERGRSGAVGSGGAGPLVIGIILVAALGLSG